MEFRNIIDNWWQSIYTRLHVSESLRWQTLQAINNGFTHFHPLFNGCFGSFFERGRNFSEISDSQAAILTLSGRKSDDKKIWAKILISKTRFDAWPVFASDFSVVKSEIVFFDFSLRTRSCRSVTVITFPSAKG